MNRSEKKIKNFGLNFMRNVKQNEVWRKLGNNGLQHTLNFEKNFNLCALKYLHRVHNTNIFL